MKSHEGVCIKCRTPLMIDTMFAKEKRPFCTDCEKELNEKVMNAMKAGGKKVARKRLVFPPNKPRE